MPATDPTPLTANGLDATTGAPLLPPLSPEQVARLACGQRWSPEEIADLRWWWEYLDQDHLDTRFGIDCRRLEQAGWGVIFAPGVDEGIRRALAPLLELRREQAARDEEAYYRELIHLPGETKARFLARHGVGPGPADPRKLPYYLLVVGGPEEISFDFQYQLDVQYAVGRLHLATAEEYARYAASVVAAETGHLVRPRRAAFFGAANPDDRATHLSLEMLVEPLADGCDHQGGWEVDRAFAADATRATLAELLGGGRTPALLFTAGHGVGFHAGDPRQPAHQGALLCQDWPGPRAWRGPLLPEHYLAADDVADAADPSGLIAFHFACYGAGTPQHDSFTNGSERRAIAPRSFVARLPQRLLGHPRGGALAVVGHVDKAWSFSFDWPGAGEQRQVFESTLGRLLAGYPVGAAMEYFNQRHAELAADLSQEIEETRHGAPPDLLTLAALWTAHNDARSYLVLGDPAVRLAVGGPESGG
jgi:Peptidase family C25